jgi:hypothetical protein
LIKKPVKIGENRPVLKVQPDRTGNRQTGRSGSNPDPTIKSVQISDDI